MSHDHAGHHHGASSDARPPVSTVLLRRALLLTLGFAAVEVAGGIWTGSLALLADASHMASDALALGVALAASLISRLPPDDRRTMGYRRAEVLAAAVNALGLLVLAVVIVVEGVKRVSAPPEVAAGPMLGIAVVGLVVNLVIAWGLARGEGGDLNLRAALWHVLGDALGSVGAIVASLLLLLRGWTLADPVASIAIAGIIGVGGLRMLVEVGGVLMHNAPPEVDVQRLRGLILGVPGVQGLHQLHLWSLAPGTNVLTVHVVVGEGHDAVLVTHEVREACLAAGPLRHVTVQADRPGECGEEQAPEPVLG